MGRKYRLQRDTRLRQKGARRTPRVSAPLRATVRRRAIDIGRVIAGIDVGEDFLDIARIGASRRIELSRIDLRGIASSSQATRDVALLIADQSRLGQGAIAIVDSPRWPRDLDCSRYGVRRRDDLRQGRAIDAALRWLAQATIHRSISLFPTPAMNYFIDQLNRAGCKPHLKVLGVQLFGSALRENREVIGGTFTRFMITGFATYRALTMLGVQSHEGYPDLQFRLWNEDRPMPSKAGGKSIALAHRREVVARLANQLKCNGQEAIATLDHADATILALSGMAIAAGAVGVALEHLAEGSFLVALPSRTGVAFAAR